MTEPASLSLAYGLAMRPLDHGACMGDAALVKISPQGALMAVIDGLGHGGDAQEAAQEAVRALEESLLPVALDQLFRTCHERLKKTRGAVMNVAWCEGHALTWLGVGNVEGVLVRPGANHRPTRQFLVAMGGILGERLPPLRPVRLAIRPGDFLVFATDGIQSDFPEGLFQVDDPQACADQILADHARDSDDALVLVAHFREAP